MRVFEVGDEVLVRNNFWIDSPAKYLNEVGVNFDMESYAGMRTIIKGYRISRDLGERLYSIDIDRGRNVWVSDWLYSLELEVREGDNL